MNELKPEDVMRALEHCANNESCTGCGWRGHTDGCIDALMRDALALIKMLTEQNLALGQVILKKDAEIERLMREKTALECVVSSARNQGRADAITEFAEKVCREIEQTPNANEFFVNSWKAKLSEIEKELKGEQE